MYISYKIGKEGEHPSNIICSSALEPSRTNMSSKSNIARYFESVLLQNYYSHIKITFNYCIRKFRKSLNHTLCNSNAYFFYSGNNFLITLQSYFPLEDLCKFNLRRMQFSAIRVQWVLENGWVLAPSCLRHSSFLSGSLLLLPSSAFAISWSFAREERGLPLLSGAATIVAIVRHCTYPSSSVGRRRETSCNVQ